MGEAYDSARAPLLGHQKTGDTSDRPRTAVYARRWYVLAVYCNVGLCQAIIQLTWGPITQSAKAVFNWKDSTIATLVNCGNFAYFFCCFPICYFLEVQGMFAYAFVHLLGLSVGRCLFDVSLFLCNRHLLDVLKFDATDE